MASGNLDWYVEQIINEVKIKMENNYTGQLTYQFNLYFGGISNLLMSSNKSVKAPKELEI